ncbi:MAG: co-chaperone GroES family protein [Rhodothermaceae bacterium]|nr:co-chaperone GroES family protein [Rhodothermaceae bacterium]
MDEIIIVGDRVLIRPDDGERQTKTGLYLPATVVDQDNVNVGQVVRVGPGYVIPNPEYSDSETWAPSKNVVRYLPLQAQPGDTAFFLRKEMIQFTFKEENFVIVPHSAILALVRTTADDILNELEDNLGDLDDLIDT